MSRTQPGRIVIRRKRVHVESPHGGSWKIAYADFVTAMMAFLPVMWLLALVPSTDLEAMPEYFPMPLMDAVRGGPNVDNSSSVIPGGSPSIVPNQHPIIPRPDSSAEGDRRDTERLEDLKRELENLIEHDPVLKFFRPQLLLDMTPDGLRIQIIDKQNRPMFATGSAQVQAYMRTILRELGPVFNTLPNSISIAGHTDAVRYASGEREYSNWELSADRANAARQELVAGGMEEQKIRRILGMSSSVSLIKDNPEAAVNRRISIVVLNQRAERRIDEQNASGASAIDVEEMMQPARGPGLSIPGLPEGIPMQDTMPGAPAMATDPEANAIFP
jgi:chemotaxis protein MotB